MYTPQDGLVSSSAKMEKKACADDANSTRWHNVCIEFHNKTEECFPIKHVVAIGSKVKWRTTCTHTLFAHKNMFLDLFNGCDHIWHINKSQRTWPHKVHLPCVELRICSQCRIWSKWANKQQTQMTVRSDSPTVEWISSSHEVFNIHLICWKNNSKLEFNIIVGWLVFRYVGGARFLSLHSKWLWRWLKREVYQLQRPYQILRNTVESNAKCHRKQKGESSSE